MQGRVTAVAHASTATTPGCSAARQRCSDKTKRGVPTLKRHNELLATLGLARLCSTYSATMLIRSSPGPLAPAARDAGSAAPCSSWSASGTVSLEARKKSPAEERRAALTWSLRSLYAARFCARVRRFFRAAAATRGTAVAPTVKWPGCGVRNCCAASATAVSLRGRGSCAPVWVETTSGWGGR